MFQRLLRLSISEASYIQFDQLQSLSIFPYQRQPDMQITKPAI